MQTDESDSENVSEGDDNKQEPKTEHRTKEQTAGILHGALEKIMNSVSSFIKQNKKNNDNAETDLNYEDSDPEETEEYIEEEEYAKATYYMLTKEEHCHLKAQREMERLSRKSPAFSQCLASCVQTPIRDGIAIGCPNVPIYRLVKACTEDAEYLITIYEP